MSRALYRKYRPQTLDAVIGQPQVTDTLKKSLASDKISHAYLFIGPRGTGKTSVARIFAHAINHFDYELEDDYIDIIEIDAASNTGVDNIRELREKAIVAPTKGKYKVYIIDEVHMLSKSAFNALLKTLEEPPAHVIFIMATTDAYKVPVTITSRAQTYTFKLAEPDVMLKYLRSVCDKEGIKIDDDALNIIARRGGGSFRDSMSLLDQISTLSDQTITKGLVIKALGLPEDEKIAQLLADYSAGLSSAITTSLKELLASGLKPETLAEEMLSQIIADPRPELLPLLEKLPDVRAPFPEAKLLVALLIQLSQAQSKITPSQLPSRPASVVSAPVATSSSDKSCTDQASSSTCSCFSWDNFLEKVKAKNDAVFNQLSKCEYEINSHVVNIFPAKKIIKTILTRNQTLLTTSANGYKIVICDPDIRTCPTDPLISQISDIMGKVEEENGGENPF